MKKLSSLKNKLLPLKTLFFVSLINLTFVYESHYFVFGCDSFFLGL
jgi:hypothetical protein